MADGYALLMFSIEEHIRREPTRRTPRGDWEAWEEKRLRELQKPTQKEETHKILSSALRSRMIYDFEEFPLAPLLALTATATESMVLDLRRPKWSSYRHVRPRWRVHCWDDECETTLKRLLGCVKHAQCRLL